MMLNSNENKSRLMSAKNVHAMIIIIFGYSFMIISLKNFYDWFLRSDSGFFADLLVHNAVQDECQCTIMIPVSLNRLL